VGISTVPIPRTGRCSRVELKDVYVLNQPRSFATLAGVNDGHAFAACMTRTGR
jgi:hypothetical protein